GLSVVFFFSSRRRYTSFSRDWSSDVCSSDLARRRKSPAGRLPPRGHDKTPRPGAGAAVTPQHRSQAAAPPSRPAAAKPQRFSHWMSLSGVLVIIPSTPRAARRSHARGSSADRKSTRLNSSHVKNSYAVYVLKKKE